MNQSVLTPIDEAIEAFRNGSMVIIVDDEDRENEGDLVIAAEHADPAAINFMATHGRGLICLAMRGALLDRLQIPMMVPDLQNRSGFGTGFTVSIEAVNGVSTGISAPDRAHTIKTLIDPGTTMADIAMPGHVFPLRARDGGVLERRGQTEASVDLAMLADLVPAGVICEVMGDDGEMMRLPALTAFAKVHGLPIISVDQLAEYRRSTRDRMANQTANGTDVSSMSAEMAPSSRGVAIANDVATGTVRSGSTNTSPSDSKLSGGGRHAPPLSRITLIGRSRLPTAAGDFDIAVFRDAQGFEHSALIKGEPHVGGEPPLVRVHSECLTGDAFGSLRCDCGEQLQSAMRRVAASGHGIVLYLRQEGRGIGLGNKIRAYELQDEGADTVEANLALGFPADARHYGVAAAMLRALEVQEIRLLSNNPEKHRALVELGIRVRDVISHVVPSQPENANYRRTKVERMGHDAALDDTLDAADATSSRP